MNKYLTALLAALLFTASSAQSFMQKGKILSSSGKCGNSNIPSLMQSWTYYGPSFTSTYGEVYNAEEEFIGICSNVQPPNAKGDFSGAGNSYRGGCLSVNADWASYPCYCDAVFRNNSNYKMVCEVTTPEGKTVVCSASYEVTAENEAI